MPIRSPSPPGFPEPPPADDDRRERSGPRLPPPRSGPPPTVPPTADFVGGARVPLSLVPDKRRRDKRTTDPHDPIVPRSPRRAARPAPPRPGSPTPAPPDIDVPGVGSGASVTAPRRLALPRPVTVIAAADDGRPLEVSGREIDSIRESWLIEDRWWTQRPLRRRYWEVVTTCGRNVVVFCDLVDGRWFAQRG